MKERKITNMATNYKYSKNDSRKVYTTQIRKETKKKKGKKMRIKSNKK